METMVDREDSLTALGAVAEPLRRRLYLHVAAAPEAVTREEAGEALGISRSVAAFHLDKLAEAGLLAVEYRRPPGRGGPGAGRPAKHYRPVEAEVAFTVPERHYDLVATILARAIADAEGLGVPVGDALRAVARDYGRAIGADVSSLRGTQRARVVEALRAHGYEPRPGVGTVFLENCPFHALAEEQRDLVCGMNAELLAGVLEGARATGMTARLDPAPRRCCVIIRED